MSAFEHLTVRHDCASDEDELVFLNSYGEVGWQFVTVRKVNTGQGLQEIDVYYFKREKENQDG